MTKAPVAVAVLLLVAAAAVAAEPPIKAGSVQHRTSEKHHHPYSLYVPAGMSPKASAPLVISSHGRNGSGKGEIGQWVGLAKKHGFIVACPDMCTATVDRPPTSKLDPAVEDEEVILSIHAEIARSFRINRRATMITGFSGGGNPSYWTGLRHPDLISHICTRGGNFAPQQIPNDEKLIAAGKDRLRIYIYYGEHDHPLILGEGGKPGQAKMAYEALTKAGYQHVEIEEIPGMKHQSRANIAADWFGEYLTKNKKLFAAGDKADDLIAEIREAIAKEKYRNAVRDLVKLERHEKKSGLPPESGKLREQLNGIGRGMLGEARSNGDPGEAKKIAGRVSRDFRGIEAGDEARALVKELGQ